MQVEDLDHQPVFSSSDEMVEHFAHGREVLAMAPAKITEGPRRWRAILKAVLFLLVAGLLSRLGEEILAEILAASLTETGLALLVLVWGGFYVYRLFRPKSGVLLVTHDAVIGLKDIKRSDHGLSVGQLLSIPADRISKYRFSKIRFPTALLFVEEVGKTGGMLQAAQHRLWNKKYLLGSRGRSLRDVISILRGRSVDEPGADWGREASTIPLYAKRMGVAYGAILGVPLAILLGIIGIGSLFSGPDAEELMREAVEAERANDMDRALELYTQAAEDGNSHSQARLGALYESGSEVPQDLVKAAGWYREAALQGHAAAQSGLGSLYFMGQGGLPADTAEAHKWLGLAARQGDPRGQNNLGALLEMQGHTDRAYDLFLAAAEQGFAAGERNVGRLHFSGEGARRDHREAYQWYERAALQDDATSQTQLGYMLSQGLGVEADFEQAMTWYERAAAQGDTTARRNMEILERQRDAREAVAGLDLTLRPSQLENGTQVLRIRNASGVRLRLELRCHRGSTSKTIPVDLTGFETEEVGFLEGWTGNFRSGDRCDLRYSGARLRNFSIR